MSELKILTMKALRTPLPGGGTLRGAFDVEIAGLRLRSCRIIETDRGDLIVKPPKCADARGNGRGGIRFVDTELWAAFKTRSLAAYAALDGDDDKRGVSRFLNHNRSKEWHRH
jgi:hypothetical protein